MKTAEENKKINKVAALLAVYNRLHLTQRCIAALRAAADSSICLTIVVVDDGSTDGTTEWLEEQPDITVLHGDGDLWFGGATDVGLRHLREQNQPPQFVLILNNDTFMRPLSLGRMVAESSSNRVVATAFWTEDKHELCTTGYAWQHWNGLVDVSRTKKWPVNSDTTVPVDAVSTTVVLIPFPLLREALLPDAAKHPHHRYDAVLSARLRKAGASFGCITKVLSDHAYGPQQNRPSVRAMRLRGFLRESFYDRRSIWHFPGGMALAWETAPNWPEAIWALAKRVGVFLRQLLYVSINSLRSHPEGCGSKS